MDVNLKSIPHSPKRRISFSCAFATGKISTFASGSGRRARLRRLGPAPAERPFLRQKPTAPDDASRFTLWVALPNFSGATMTKCLSPVAPIFPIAGSFEAQPSPARLLQIFLRQRIVGCFCKPENVYYPPTLAIVH